MRRLLVLLGMVAAVLVVVGVVAVRDPGYRNIPAGCELDQGQSFPVRYGEYEFYGDSYVCSEM